MSTTDTTTSSYVRTCTCGHALGTSPAQQDPRVLVHLTGLAIGSDECLMPTTTTTRDTERRARMAAKVASGEVTAEYAEWYLGCFTPSPMVDTADEDRRIALAERRS